MRARGAGVECVRGACVERVVCMGVESVWSACMWSACGARGVRACGARGVRACGVRVERVMCVHVERVRSAWCAGGTHVGGAPGGTLEALAARRCAPTAPGRAACGWGPVRSDRLPPGLNAFRLLFDM